ncbi:retention module-containing protein [Photobacterium galatheae]|uniref:retention module-containing protein n=1 Tax=Photobacterium galatheae TaxID=1654360 RepID=UPI00202CC0E8|nr:retention module-containing protein [Photobacterium galatheae]MCM0148668.1 retention module-containing protein [Photobacterium galatheae]
MEAFAANHLATLTVEQGVVYVIRPDGSVKPVQFAYQVLPDELVVANGTARYVMMRHGEPVIVDRPCPTCVLLDSKGFSVADIDERIQFEQPGPGQPQGTDIDIAQLQALILAGEDPTEVFEAAAAGGNAASGGIAANGGFVTVNYDGDSTLTEAGFETDYQFLLLESDDDRAAIYAAGGGEGISLSLTEGDLSPATYPVQTTIAVLIEAGTLPLDPASFTFDAASLNALLSELSSEVTSGGQPVSFRFDEAQNAIIGEVQGQPVLTITLTAESSGRDVTVTVTTVLSGPVDHLEGSSSGRVTNGNDTLQILADVQGADLAGNPLDSPVSVSLTVLDGPDPVLMADSGTNIDESADMGVAQQGAVPLDLGADAIQTLVFNPDQPDLTGLTSHGFATILTVDGNQLTLTDVQGETVLTVTIGLDGTYTATLFQPIDELTSEEILFSLGVTATDHDGDPTTGSVVLRITDGSNASGGETIALAVIEPDFSPNAFPATDSNAVTVTAGGDRLDPATLTLDSSQADTLLAELAAEVQSGNQPLTFTYDPATNTIEGRLPDGTLAVDIVLTTVQDANGLDLVLTATLTQYQPLDHLSGGNTTGLVSVSGETIVVTVPVQARDTDGDFLDMPVLVISTITDGVLPAFGEDSGAIVNESLDNSNDNGSPVAGQIALDVGSDALAAVTVMDNQALADAIGALTSNGNPVSYTVTGNQLQITGSNGDTLLTVTLSLDGSYQVVITGPFDELNADDQIVLPVDVLATDHDGDTAQGQIAVTILDGADAAGGETASLSFTEPDSDPNFYPATGTADFTITAGADRLVPDSLTLDPAQLANVLADLSAVLTSDQQAITFTFNPVTGVVEGRLPDNTLALEIRFSAGQSGDQDLAVSVSVTQHVPLDHVDSTVTSPYVTTNGETIALTFPFNAQDTDGDSLAVPVEVMVTISDGDLPDLQTDSGVTANETTNAGQTLQGSIGVDIGSDGLASLLFDETQPTLTFTSNGLPVSLIPNGNQITLQDSNGTTILTVTLAPDGQYDVVLTGTLDHLTSDALDIPMNLVLTDNDGDQDTGVITVTVTDGANPPGGDVIFVNVTEPELDPDNYPAQSTAVVTVVAGADRLVPESVQIAPDQLADLIAELNAELTSGGEPLSFAVNPATGALEGTLGDGTLVLSLLPSAVQVADSSDISLTLTVTQHAPLDHNPDGNAAGRVAVDGDNIVIQVPLQVSDVDGDPLETPVTGTVTVVDGKLPVLLADSGVSLNETDDQGATLNGTIGVDIGSDAIASLNFSPDQPGLSGIESNGAAVSFQRVDDDTLEVLDSVGNVILTVSIDESGAYDVTLTGAFDQTTTDPLVIPLNVILTDDDGDTDTGIITLRISDGGDPAGGETIAVTVTEPDLAPNDYPAITIADVVITAGSDRLLPESVQIDPAQVQALLDELNAEVASGSSPLSFSYDPASGVLQGVLADGTVALRIELTATQEPDTQPPGSNDVSLNLTLTQNLPLNHNPAGNSDGFVAVDGDNIVISFPVQAEDADGDALITPVTATATIVDGAIPQLLTDTGVTVNETADSGVLNQTGSIGVDTGSDAIASLNFAMDQPGLAGITSGGQAVTFAVNGNEIIVRDVNGSPVMTVTMAEDGSYDVLLTGALDQDAGNSLDLVFDLVVTDDDGDTNTGSITVTVTDGDDPAGGGEVSLNLTEPDLSPSAYPETVTVTGTVAAGSDRLNPDSVQIDPAQLATLIAELNAELTSGGEQLTFSYDPATGDLTGVLADGTPVLTLSLTASQAANGQDAILNLTVTQHLPLDHLSSGNDAGLVSVNGTELAITVPVQMSDTDGDPLQQPVNAQVTIVDGALPSLGLDPGTNFTETMAEQTVNGRIALDVGSDAIAAFVFDDNQPSLTDLVSNGANTSYTVTGNVITLVSDADGSPVLTITLNNDGSYTVVQHQPLAQLNAGDVTELILPVTAVDQDGDVSNSGNLIINITDGPDPDGGNQTLAVTEGDLETPVPADEYPVSQTLNFAINAVTDDLVAGSLVLADGAAATLESELAALTSNGEALTVSVDESADGVVTITVVAAGSGEPVLTLTFIAAQNGSDVGVVATVEQFRPLEHVDFNGNIVLANGSEFRIAVPLQLSDSDGDPLQNPNITQVVILDGDLPAFGADTGVSLSEGDTGVATGSGSIAVDTGSDERVGVFFAQTQASLDNLTSNGFETDYTVNGNTVTVTRTDDPAIIVLTATIDLDGNYVVNQFQPLDQFDAPDNNNLTLSVLTQDRDGDLSVPGTLNVTIADGTNPDGSFTGQDSISVTEGDLTPTDPVSGYPVSGQAQLSISAGVDRLDPEAITLDAAALAILISELTSEITAGGQPVSAVWHDDSKTLMLSAGGTTVLTATLVATQSADGMGVDLTVNLEQLAPLDHNGTDTGGVVVSENDVISFPLPVQIQDTDGDFLDNTIPVSVTISDGLDPVINTIDAVSVSESDLNGGNGVHPGTNPGGNGESATGQIAVDSGSDEIADFVVDVAAFNAAHPSLTSGGNPVTLIYDAATDTYQGQANGVTVFVLAMNVTTGNYTFTLTGALDHTQPDNDTSLQLDFQVTAVDQDDDVSASATLSVMVNDDVPAVTDVAFASVEEGQTTSTIDLLPTAEAGADDAEVTAVTDADGNRTELANGTPDANGFVPVDIFQNGQLLGQLFVHPEGDAFFVSAPDIDHDDSTLTSSLSFEVTDGDNDLDTAVVILSILDEAPSLLVAESTGFEEQGRFPDPDETLDDPTQGIPVNMTLDLGDQDRGESIGDVFIVLPAEPHGDFYLNGVLLTPAGGQIALPASAFSDSDGDGVFELQGVTFVPDPDYSTAAEPGFRLAFDVTAQINVAEGTPPAPLQSTLMVDVQGVADIPVWDPTAQVYYGDGEEDGDNISISASFNAGLQDTDGSEALVYFVRMVEGEGQIVGEGLIAQPDGFFLVPLSAIDTVAVDPADNFSGDIRLELIAQSRETLNPLSGAETAQSVEQAVVINVLPVADDAQLKVTRVESLEDEPIPLSDHITLTELDDTADDFGTETLFIRISDLPEGAVLLQNGTPLTPDANGVYEFAYTDIGDIQLQPVPESNVDFTMTVEGVVRDSVEITLADGSTSTVTDERVIPAKVIEVTLTGVADEPDFAIGGTDWTLLPDGTPGVETTINEDDEAVLDFRVVSGELVLAPTDTSETVSMVISNIPAGTQIFDASGNPQALVYAGIDPATGTPKYEVKLAAGAITVKPPLHSTQDIVLDAKIVVTENDGDQLEQNSQIVIHIEPVIDAGDYSQTSQGLEDQPVTIHWQPPFTDSKEFATGLTIENVPTDPGYSLQINSGGVITVLTVDASGSVTLSEAEFALLQGGAELQLIVPEDSDLNVTLNTRVTVQENDVDSAVVVTREVAGTLHVNLTAVVEPDGVLGVQTGTDGNGDPVFAETLVTGDRLDLTGGNGSAGVITFSDLDPSSDEVVTDVVLTFRDAAGNLLTGFVVEGAINNGDGSWYVPDGNLDQVVVIAPPGFSGTVTVEVAGRVHDLSDDGDVSALVTLTDEIQVTFDRGAVDQDAAEIQVDNSVEVTGTEDTPVDLGSFLNQIISLDTGAGDQGDDELSLVIDAGSLPPGVTLSGTEFNFVTNQYVIKTSVNADGSLDLSGVTLNLPQDFAGDFTINVQYVNTDTVSGDTTQQLDDIPIRISPVVDQPGFQLNVVETQGLDANFQPVSDTGEPEVIQTGTAFEDGRIILDVTGSVGDISTTQDEGLETIMQVVISVSDPATGSLLDANGNPVASLTVTDPAQLSQIAFQPAEDFSGTVSLTLDVQVTDTASYDITSGPATESDTATFTNTVSFEVIAVNDAVDFTGTEMPVIGDEDTAISLTGVGGTVVDIDGSERILSVKLTQVPAGFVIEGAANNGGGEWTIAVPPGSTTFDLSSITITPPMDFSGTAEIGITVFTQEDSLPTPVAQTTTFTLQVDPVADRVDTDVTPTASGSEDQNIDLLLNIEAFDDAPSVTNGAANVTENPPETLQILVSNVPDSSRIELPPGVTGTVTDQGDGTWLVTVDSADLDRLIFVPGDANRDNWNGELNLAIRAVDQTDVATDDKAVFVTVTVEIDSVNDAPVNVVPADPLSVDEDNTLLITSLQITDVDADEVGEGTLTVTLSVTDGALVIPDGSETGALSITGDGTETLVLEGAITAINALLGSGINFTPDPNFNGEVTLTMTTNDQGNTGSGGALEDTDTVTIQVQAINDVPELPEIADQTVDEDAVLVISGLSVSDSDFDEAASTGVMAVTLSADHGRVTVTVPSGSAATVTENGTEMVTLEGSLDEINAILAAGVNYQGNTDFNGNDAVTVTVNDQGNVGADGPKTATTTINITVTPVATPPTLTLNVPQTAVMRGALGVMIPLLGLEAVAGDANETLTVEIRNLGAGQLVDSSGTEVGTDLGSGRWTVTPGQLSDLFVSNLPEGTSNLEIVAVSEEVDGSQAESAPIAVEIRMDNPVNTSGTIGAGDSDAPNLVISADGENTLLGGENDDLLIGGLGQDILVGGAGDDILWGGEAGGSGDGVRDLFKWIAADLGSAGNAANDIVKDFEAGIDGLDLTEAVDTSGSTSFDDLAALIQLVDNGGNTVLNLLENGVVVQSIVLEGVSQASLLGADPTGLSDGEKLETLFGNSTLLLNLSFATNGNDVQAATDAPDPQQNEFPDEVTLSAGFEAESEAGQDATGMLNGNEPDAGVSNPASLLMPEHIGALTDRMTGSASGAMTDQETLLLADVLREGADELTHLLEHLEETVDRNGSVDLPMNTENGQHQRVAFGSAEPGTLGLEIASAVSDIVASLFDHNPPNVEP